MKRVVRMLGSRARLLCLVLLALVPLAGFMAVQGSDMRARRIQEAHERVRHLAHLATASYEDVISDAKGLLKSAAEFTLVADTVAFNCARALTALKQTRDWIDGLFKVDQSGIVRCTTNAQFEGSDFSERRDIIEGIAAGSFHLSDGFISPVRLMPIIRATMPAETFLGEKVLLAANIDLSWLDRLSERIGKRAGAKVLLIDSKGTVLSAYPPRPQWLGNKLPSVQFLTGIMSGRSGERQMDDVDGTPAFVGYASVTGSGLRLAVSIERASVLSDVERDTMKAVLAFLAVACGASLFIWSFGRRFFVDPLSRLGSLLKATLDNMDQGLVVVDSSGRLPICNDRARDLLDLPEALIKSQPLAREVIEFQRARGEFAGLNLDEMRMMECKEPVRTIYERETTSGRVLEIRSVPFADGGVVRTYSDVTARRLQERRMAESEARYRVLAENSSDMIVQASSDFSWTYVSPACSRILGRDACELMGRAHYDLIHPDDIPAMQAARAALATCDNASVVKRLRHADGHYVWVEGELTRLRSSTCDGSMLVGVYRDISVRKQAEEALIAAHEAMARIARNDGLTGLANRRTFDEKLGEEHARSFRTKTPLSILMVDVDHFKLFNDTYGHLEGDECLRQIAGVLASCARRPGDLAARFGGEEFTLLLPDTNAEGARAVAEGLLEKVRNLKVMHEMSPSRYVTVSVGCTTFACGAGDPKDLVREADTALYAAKSSGRDRICDAAGSAQAA